MQSGWLQVALHGELICLKVAVEMSLSASFIIDLSLKPPPRSGQNQVTMHKCFMLLTFMVIILPSLGLTRYSLI